MGSNALATQRLGHACMLYNFQPDVYGKGKNILMHVQLQ